MVSRSALQFLRRVGLADESPRPAPRLDLSALLIHTIPVPSPPLPPPEVLRTFEGLPPPDRDLSRPWPGQTEF
jgi:hypothetical protein